MFESLTDKLTAVFNKITSRGVLSEEDINSTMREIRIALLEADVALPVVKSFIETAKEKALGQQVIKSVQPSQQIVKIVNDTLVEVLSDKDSALNLNVPAPAVILMAGLQGAGKTTSAAKLGLKLKKDRKKVLLASLDIYRPAAREQLAQMGVKTGVDTLPIVEGETVMRILQRAFEQSAKGGYDVLILDSAGRLHLDEQMMDELKEVKKQANPAEILLTVDSMTGQDAVQVAKAFNEQLGVTGIILTRTDGDARGGAALSMRSVTGKPIKFLGTGEKPEDLEAFDAERVAGRLLGMGDVVGLVETAMDKIKKEDAEKMAQRMMSGSFNLNDMLEQLRQIQKMGDLKGIMMMIPGLSQFKKQIENSEIGDKLIKRQEAIILSMTKKERKNPDIIKAMRKKRIAEGSGTTVQEVNKLLKQYEQMSEMMKKMKKLGPLGMMGAMKNLSSMLPPGMPPMGGKFPFKF